MVKEKTRKRGKRKLKDVTRHIRSTVERELWARAAGRCQFRGCNRILYKSSVTQEGVNISQMAHIYSFSRVGPRGRGPLKKTPRLLNHVENLMLVCHGCHKTIDQEEDGGRYPAELLSKWKCQHEKRIAVVTGVDPKKRSTVVLYGTNIGDERSPLQPQQTNWALFPHWYPSDEVPLCLSMTWEGKDAQLEYWTIEGKNLQKNFDRVIRPRVEAGDHFSIFGFAPMPLLIQLGTLFTDKISAQVYQLRREPEQTWQWSEKSHKTDYIIEVPSSFDHQPALIISLSAKIAHHRVMSVLGANVSIWELTIAKPNNDFLKTRDQLSKFRETIRHLLAQIAEKHGNSTLLPIFPAMPVATAVELGRVRMPKADMTFPQFRGHLVKPPLSSLRTRPGSHSRASSAGASDYRTPRCTQRYPVLRLHGSRRADGTRARA